MGAFSSGGTNRCFPVRFTTPENSVNNWACSMQASTTAGMAHVHTTNNTTIDAYREQNDTLVHSQTAAAEPTRQYPKSVDSSPEMPRRVELRHRRTDMPKSMIRHVYRPSLKLHLRHTSNGLSTAVMVQVLAILIASCMLTLC